MLNEFERIKYDKASHRMDECKLTTGLSSSELQYPEFDRAGGWAGYIVINFPELKSCWYMLSPKQQNIVAYIALKLDHPKFTEAPEHDG